MIKFVAGVDDDAERMPDCPSNSGVEVYVKTKRTLPASGLVGFDAHDKTSTTIPTSATCYSCHAQHAAVDTTFIQFYPRVLPIAKSKGTLSAGVPGRG